MVIKCPKCGSDSKSVEHFVTCYNYCQKCDFIFNQIDTQRHFRKLNREKYAQAGIEIDNDGNVVSIHDP